jgi:hypothetical protein
MRHRYYSLITILPLAVLLAGCSDGPGAAPAKTEPAKPVEPVTAESAFRQMFVKARSWAPDALPLRMGDLDLAEVKNKGGKAGAWQCTFVSPTSHSARTYTFSVVESGKSNVHEGVFGGPPESWSGGGQDTPFRVEAFQTDSVKAYEIAMKKNADFAKQHKDLPVKFLLEQGPDFTTPTWRVFWGPTVGTSSFSVFVDAASGSFLKALR